MYNNIPLPWLKEKKFLGIWLDPKLTLECHINNVERNACKGLNVMRSLAGVYWGSDPKTLAMMYKTIVRSHFDYSTLAYINANISLLRKLDILQNRALRIITGAMCSTPINSMECESCIPPLLLRRIQIAERFCLKLMSLNNNYTLNHILPPSYNLINSEPYMDCKQLMSGFSPTLLRICVFIKSVFVNMNITDSWPMYSLSFSALIHPVNISNKKILTQSDLHEFIGDNNDVYRIYTDGSKSSDGVTSAFYDPQLKISKCFQINDNCTIYTAECYAILKALEYACNVNNCHIIILTDSQSALLGLEKTCLKYNTSYILYEIKKMLYDMHIHGKVVQLQWVPSHNGIIGNELADQATRGRADGNHSNWMKTPYTDFRCTFTMALKSLYKEYWKTVSKEEGTWYADIQKAPPAQIWYNKLKQYNRKCIVTIITLPDAQSLI
ncbi:pol protein [Danaus plexippus plexippus]|uniref:ribonuclease H n=1 Tax=Danaus plexippus plexippus TaxID=278856 RepID=A0A212F371_DANPL|nr:pol protein [Danaus plexippus plexippus]